MKRLLLFIIQGGARAKQFQPSQIQKKAAIEFFTTLPEL